MFIPVKDDGTAGEAEVFAEGWLTPTGEYMGCPVDVQMLQDGSLLVSDMASMASRSSLMPPISPVKQRNIW
jgi:glucose/arabinose dehydrogenase